ncbi:MAG: phenylalanine--tRNA ligase subunit beta [Candidatus Sungbacteria bacterium RIFCSPLOWO2_01_FULL_60_25]|uniref:Phenylalanine--tRNA ligase beta subunit n=1 Tax=Candidatus Sungbacteria bacterium RIFCSPLOWO2_01_FULL_60_25 TaxID=1802281 RepID=A0A1G2LH70_9BACT|nr:MAG: phenylalanine--tRNA ligase subunit beta [Candidatus Sungbacteria bacterium RIFCSPLOWO2_01_FULL_60_25]
MKFSYNWLKALYPKIPPPEKSAELLTFHAFQVEGLEKVGTDIALDLDQQVLGRRASDASGHLGIAREIAVIRGGELKTPPVAVKEDPKIRADDLLRVRVETPLVARYSARVLTGITVGPSPKWMQERLRTSGLRPINVVVDTTNYVMLETGQPLHAFDCDKLRNGENKKLTIIARQAKKGETLETLGDEGQRLTLAATDIVIADANGPIGLGGIKGGKGSEIRSETKRIVIEAANFDPATIRLTAQRLKLRTDASWRFEHGISPEMATDALDRAAELLAKHAHGRIAKGTVDAYPQKEPRRAIPFSPSRAASLMGVAVPEAVAVSILKRLGCAITKKTRGLYRVIPPFFRRDLAIEEDLIEEVARIWGLEKIPAVLPVISGGIAKKSDRRMFEDALKDRLVGLGFTESHLSSFIGERTLALFQMLPEHLYHLENPTSPETAMLMNLAIVQYIRSASENLRHFDAVRIFGIGRNFTKTPAGPVERRTLIIALAERGKDGREEFYTLKGAVDTLLEASGIADHSYDNRPEALRRHTVWAHPGRMAEIVAGENVIGVIGELSPEFTTATKSRARIALAELDIEKLLAAIETEQEFRPIGKYPSIIRDIAVVVPEDAKADDVEGVIENAGGELLADSDLFDYFQDEAMTERGEKSLAFHLVFQSPKKTLTDGEVNRLYTKITAALRERGWEVRE